MADTEGHPLFLVSTVSSRTALAGVPIASHPAGISFPSGTRAPAATSAPLPIRAPDKTTAPMPISAPSSTHRPVDDGAVPDGDVLADPAGQPGVGVQHRPVLDIRPLPDFDRLEIASQHRIEPDAHVVVQRAIADHPGARRDEDPLSDPGLGRPGEL